jgi:hypothetical protein
VVSFPLAFLPITYIAVTILDIIHRPGFYLKQNISETAMCLSLQVKHTQVGPIDGGSLCLQSGISLNKIILLLLFDRKGSRHIFQRFGHR